MKYRMSQVERPIFWEVTVPSIKAMDLEYNTHFLQTFPL
jgi:hypothetical protein